MNEVINEIREGMADHETRLLFLENSLPYRRAPREETKLLTPKLNENISDKEVSQSLKRLWNELLQVKGLTAHLQRELNEHIDKSSKRKKGRYLD